MAGEIEGTKEASLGAQWGCGDGWDPRWRWRCGRARAAQEKRWS
jgi:hypothetical protein